MLRFLADGAVFSKPKDGDAEVVKDIVCGCEGGV